MYEAKFAGGGTTRAAEALGDRTGDGAPTKQRRPDRVVESLVRSALTGARDDERQAAALAERYALGVAKRRGATPEALPPLRMLVAAAAADRVAGPGAGVDREMSLLLLRGLRAEWRAGGDAELAEVLAPAVVELAWLQLDRPIGQSLSVEEALVRVRALRPDLEVTLFEELAGVARSGEVERRQPVEAA